MKVESRIFEILTVFFFVAGIVYAVVAREPVGIAGLFGASPDPEVVPN